MSSNPTHGGESLELRRRLAAVEERLSRPANTAGAIGLPVDGSDVLDNIFFRQLFENSPDAIVLLDTEDRIFDANSAF
ncbi:MAG: PAS domain-containing protein, partial [Acidobacteriota bacterium]|nr:PAS domain-containing protein [Acidobacteriota bacterium]